MSRLKAISRYLIGIPYLYLGVLIWCQSEVYLGNLWNGDIAEADRGNYWITKYVDTVSVQRPCWNQSIRQTWSASGIPIPSGWHHHAFCWASPKPASSCCILSLIHHLHPVKKSFLSCLLSSSVPLYLHGLLPACLRLSLA